MRARLRWRDEILLTGQEWLGDPRRRNIEAARPISPNVSLNSVRLGLLDPPFPPSDSVSSAVGICLSYRLDPVSSGSEQFELDEDPSSLSSLSKAFDGKKNSARITPRAHISSACGL